MPLFIPIKFIYKEHLYLSFYSINDNGKHEASSTVANIYSYKYIRKPDTFTMWAHFID